MAGNAPQAGEKFPGKIQIRLAEHRFFGLIGMAVENPKIIFQDKSQGSAAGFGYVQKNNHWIFPSI
jgi:hypothetical protein